MNPAWSKLAQLDFLVFSAHKTATQSVTRSLKKTGFRSVHCHHPSNIDLAEGEFIDWLKYYETVNGRKLRIISTFREPLERMVSSFFQWHGIGEVRTDSGHIDHESSIIHGASIEELNSAFESFCATYGGFCESILQLCAELDISVEDLAFSESDEHGVLSMDHCEIHLFRFDQLTRRLTALLERVCGRPICEIEANIGKRQWYAAQYAEFRKKMRASTDRIRSIYQSRRSLIDLFYPGRFDELLAASIQKHGT